MSAWITVYIYFGFIAFIAAFFVSRHIYRRKLRNKYLWANHKYDNIRIMVTQQKCVLAGKDINGLNVYKCEDGSNVKSSDKIKYAFKHLDGSVNTELREQEKLITPDLILEKTDYIIKNVEEEKKYETYDLLKRTAIALFYFSLFILFFVLMDLPVLFPQCYQ